MQEEDEEDQQDFKQAEPSSSQGASAPERPGRKAQPKKTSPTTPNAQTSNHMVKAASQVSISHISTTGSIRPDFEVQLEACPGPFGSDTFVETFVKHI